MRSSTDPSATLLLELAYVLTDKNATTLSQIIHTLGINVENINIVQGDTDNTPYGWGTFASRSVVISGGACQISAQKLAIKIKEIASFYLQCDIDDLELEGGYAK